MQMRLVIGADIARFSRALSDLNERRVTPTIHEPDSGYAAHASIARSVTRPARPAGDSNTAR